MTKRQAHLVASHLVRQAVAAVATSAWVMLLVGWARRLLTQHGPPRTLSRWRDRLQVGVAAADSPTSVCYAMFTVLLVTLVESLSFSAEAGCRQRCQGDVVCRVVLLAAGEGVQSAADKAGSKVGGAVDSVKGLANEAADTARATGEVTAAPRSSVCSLQPYCCHHTLIQHLQTSAPAHAGSISWPAQPFGLCFATATKIMP